LEEQLYHLIVETFELEELPYDEVLETDDGTILKTASRMRPTQEIALEPFLLSTTPLTYRQVQTYLPNFPPPHMPDIVDANDDGDGDDVDEEENGEEKEASAGVCLTSRQRLPILQDDRFRLPSEAEWEYAARAGGKDILFASQNENRIPTQDDLVWYYHHGSEQPARNSNANAKTNTNTNANAFGLIGMGSFPELCADIWHDTLDGMPRDGSPRLVLDDERRMLSPMRAIRGGAIGSWQDCGEWANMLVYQRYPENRNGEASLRLAMDILPKKKKKKKKKRNMKCR
jgi:hypothetical protein